MPNPLSSVRPKAFCHFGGPIVAARPNLIPYIVRVIQAWSDCDLSLMRFLTHILKADFQIVAAMMQAISSGEGRRAGIDGAAATALTADDQAIYNAVMKVVRPSRKVRNSFAHHIWGLSPDLPDSLLLIDPKYLVEKHADNLNYDRASDAEREEIERTSFDNSKINVWSETDFQASAAQAEKAAKLIGCLGPALRKEGTISRALWRIQLLADPEVQQALQATSR